jgi:3-oxoacyl-[acyl-carrier protein] reductase
MLQSLSLTNKIAIVTGSSSGIGRMTALTLARSGANVLVHAGKNRDGAEETAKMIRDIGRETLVVLADLFDQKEQDRFVEAVLGWRGRVDILVNNAGADVLTGPAGKKSFEEKLAILWQVDVTATMRLSRAIGRAMKEQIAKDTPDHSKHGAGSESVTPRETSGAIVNIGWDQVEFGMAGDSGELFAATKGALMAFTRSLARSLAPHVRVNAVAPGWIKTAWGQGANEVWQKRAIRESLLERWGTPEDIAEAILYLVSPASSFVTGHILPVNGGYRGSCDG